MERAKQRVLDDYLSFNPEERAEPEENIEVREVSKKDEAISLGSPTSSSIYQLNFAGYMTRGASFGDLKNPSKAIFRCVECGQIIVGSELAERHMREIHSFELDVQIWSHLEELAEKIDDRTAVLWASGIRLRLTPPGQPTVEDLVKPGDLVWTSYSPEKGKVVKVSRYEVHGLPCYSITYVPLDAKPFSDGSYRESDYCYLNELVAQDGRILHLYETDDSEVFYEKKQTSITEYAED